MGASCVSTTIAQCEYPEYPVRRVQRQAQSAVCAIHLGVVVCLGTCRRNERRARVGGVCLGANQCSSVGHSWCPTAPKGSAWHGRAPIPRVQVDGPLDTHTHTLTHAHTRTHTHLIWYTEFQSSFDRFLRRSRGPLELRARARAHTHTRTHTHTHTGAPSLPRTPVGLPPPVPSPSTHACVWAHWAALVCIRIWSTDSTQPTAASRVPAGHV